MPVGEPLHVDRPAAQVRQHHRRRSRRSSVARSSLVIALSVAAGRAPCPACEISTPATSTVLTVIPHHVRRLLVRPQPEVARVPQLVGAGPLGEGDLRDQPGRAQCTAFRGSVPFVHGDASTSSFVSRACRSRSTDWEKPVPTLPAYTRSSPVVVRQQQRPQRDPGPLRVGPADHDQLLAGLALELQPPVGPAGGVRRVGPLGDQPLPALAAGLGEVLLAAAAPVRCVADRPLEGEQGAQPPLAVEQRLAADVLAVGAEHVEDVEVDRHPAAPRLLRAAEVDPRLQPGERRPRALERHHLAVDDEVGRRLLLERLGDLGERHRDVAARPRVEPRPATGRGRPGNAGRRACARRPSRPPRTARGSAWPAPAAGRRSRSIGTRDSGRRGKSPA